jgi:epoxyqueuosine reductase
MTRSVIEKIFEDHGQKVFFADFESVKFENKAAEKNYRTVFLTYVPYFYNEEKDQNICLYAALEDYHKFIPRKLEPIKKELERMFPQNIFDIYTDNSPVNEKLAAQVSGLGVRGKNSLIITKNHGSFIFLAEIISDIDVKTEKYEPQNCCGCGECERACPAGALKNGICDISKCISALTQKKGELTEEEKKLIAKNGLVWGCDRCQKACPMNKDLTESEYSKQTVKLKALTRDDLDGLTDKEFRAKYHDRAFTWRGLSTVKRNIDLIHERSKTNET